MRHTFKQSIFYGLSGISVLAAACGTTDSVIAAGSAAPTGKITFFRLEKGVSFRKIPGGTPLPGCLNIVPLNDGNAVGVAARRENREKGSRLLLFDRAGKRPPAAMESDALTSCHGVLSPDGKRFYTADYSSSSVSEYALEGDLLRLLGKRPLKGTGPDPKRQKFSHPHGVFFDPAGKHLFVSDLGADAVHIFPWNAEKGVAAAPSASVKLHPGAGPRHIAFSKDGSVFYSANELDSTVSSFRFTGNRWEHVRTRPATGGKLPAGKRNYPGTIKVHPSSHWLFVTNRGIDSIAVFRLEKDGEFSLRSEMDCGGGSPSDLLFIKNGTRIVSANMNRGNLTLLEFNPATGTGNRIPRADCVFPGASSLLLLKE